MPLSPKNLRTGFYSASRAGAPLNNFRNWNPQPCRRWDRIFPRSITCSTRFSVKVWWGDGVQFEISTGCFLAFVVRSTRMARWLQICVGSFTLTAFPDTLDHLKWPAGLYAKLIGWLYCWCRGFEDLRSKAHLVSIAVLRCCIYFRLIYATRQAWASLWEKSVHRTRTQVDF